MSSLRPETTPGANAIEQDIGAFRDDLALVNPQLREISQGLIARGQGTEMDPFLNARRGEALEATRGALSRSGVTGSAALNQLNRVNSQYDTAGLGLRDQALQAGVQGLQGTSQNNLAPAGLSISAEAARNAGRGGGGGGGKGK
jgi:hypothetical protein